MTPLPPNQPERRRAGPSTEALAKSERLAHLIKIVGVALAIYVAVAVTVASVVGVVNSIHSVEEAKKGAEYAKEGARYARLALAQSKANEVIAKRNENTANDVKHLVAQQAPCLENDPPDSPACERQARADKLIADALNAISIGAHGQHQDLVNVVARLIGKRAPKLPVRTTVPRTTRLTTAAAPTTTTTRAAATTTTTRVAPTTTTTCPKLPNGKCRK